MPNHRDNINLRNTKAKIKKGGDVVNRNIYYTDTKELRKSMIDCGINSIVELSKACGVNRNSLNSILNGKTQPAVETMQKLMVALNLTPENAGKIFFANNLRNKKDKAS